MLDGNNLIKDSNVFYRDIDLDSQTFQLPQGQGFEARGEVRIGFRQLDNERWPASALYTLKITNPNLANELAGDAIMRIELTAEQGRPRNGVEAVSPKLRIESLEMDNARRNYNRKDVAFQLNTMVGNGLSETHYWLDSGVSKANEYP
jgi:hypothetical protein